MGLGWHSPAGGGGGGSGATDPALLAVLETIATELGLMRVAVEAIAAGSTPPPSPELPSCIVVNEAGEYLVDETGAYIVYECPDEVTECLVVDENGQQLVAESGALVTFTCPPTECAITLEDGSYLVTENGEYVTLACSLAIASESGDLIVDELGNQLMTEVG